MRIVLFFNVFILHWWINLTFNVFEEKENVKYEKIGKKTQGEGKFEVRLC